MNDLADRIERDADALRYVFSKREIGAIVAALRQKQGWRPINEAPKDGSSIVGVNLDGLRMITWYGKASHIPLYGWCIGDDVEEIGLWNPTAWIPLPESPR